MFYERRVNLEHDITEYLAAVDKAVGVAVEKKVGVRIITYANGDIVVRATDSVPFGQQRVEEA